MTSPEQRLVHVVDDDDAIRRSVGFMLKTSGHRVESYGSGAELLKHASQLEPGCILLDIRMPAMDGMDVHEALRERGINFPVIIMTGHGDVSLAVRAMRAGAVDFIEKPFEKDVLLDSLDSAFRRLARQDEAADRMKDAVVRLHALTKRERDVLDGLAKGLPNKTIAYDLGISPRTVEIHRANLMHKLDAKSLSEALRVAFAAQGE